MTVADFPLVYECLLDVVGGQERASNRRGSRHRHGRFYTPQRLSTLVTRLALEQLHVKETQHGPSANGVALCARLNILDPSCGSGRFLVDAAQFLVQDCASSPADAARSMYGMDIDPLAVEAARAALQIFAGRPLPEVLRNIVCGNALLDAEVMFSSVFGGKGVNKRNAGSSYGATRRALTCGGFDAILGNPPWVSYSGRQAVALGTAEHKAYLKRYSSYSGWRSTHGMFVELALGLTRVGGRIGLLLPQQLSELGGYAPVRTILRNNADIDEPCPAFGEHEFHTVTEPCFALIAARVKEREAPVDGPIACAPVAEDYSDRHRGRMTAPCLKKPTRKNRAMLNNLLDQLTSMERFPAAAFSDCGVHTGNATDNLVLSVPKRGSAPLREGRDIKPYALSLPRLWLHVNYTPSGSEYFRIAHKERFQTTPIVIRQTASRPIAALHGPHPSYFRNSCLACNGVAGIPDATIVALLNSSLFAWLHRRTTMDARQRTFPQVKIQHLRALPLPPAHGRGVAKGALENLAAMVDALTLTPANMTLLAEVDVAVFELYGVGMKLQRAVREELARGSAAGANNQR